MRETRDMALVRNAIAILGSLDRHELEPITDDQWGAFKLDPRDALRRAGDAQRAEIWAAVQRRLPAELREGALV